MERVMVSHFHSVSKSLKTMLHQSSIFENIQLKLILMKNSTKHFHYFKTATSSLLPYLTIHMQSIGLTIEEIAIIYLALPFTTFLSPPLTGKWNNPNFLNIFNLLNNSSSLISVDTNWFNSTIDLLFCTCDAHAKAFFHHIHSKW